MLGSCTTSSIISRYSISFYLVQTLESSIQCNHSKWCWYTNLLQQLQITYNTSFTAPLLMMNSVQQTYNSTSTANNIAAIALMVQNSSYLRFNLAVNAANSNTYTLQGPWLKILGIPLDYADFAVLNKQVQLSCLLQTSGYDFVNMHTNFLRAIYSANQQSQDWHIVPTIIIWTVNFISNPGKYTCFTNMSAAGKIPYTIPIMDDI